MNFDYPIIPMKSRSIVRAHVPCLSDNQDTTEISSIALNYSLCGLFGCIKEAIKTSHGKPMFALFF